MDKHSMDCMDKTPMQNMNPMTGGMYGMPPMAGYGMAPMYGNISPMYGMPSYGMCPMYHMCPMVHMCPMHHGMSGMPYMSPMAGYPMGNMERYYDDMNFPEDNLDYAGY